MHLFLRACAICCLATPLLHGAPELAAKAAAKSTLKQMLTNPGFEGPYISLPAPSGKSRITGLVAKGWRDNSAWADVTVDYAQESAGIRTGKSAQRVTVKAVRQGEVQLVQPVTIQAKHSYLASLWVKGQPGAKFRASVRQSEAPYADYGNQSLALNGKWQQLRFQATLHEKPGGMFLIYPPAGSSLVIDDASLVDAGRTR